MKILKYLTVAMLATTLVACGGEEPAVDTPDNNDSTAQVVDGEENPPAEAPSGDASIVGSWKFEALEMPDLAAAAGESTGDAQMDEMAANMMAGIEEMMAQVETQLQESGALEIREDGTLVGTMINNGAIETNDGTWELSDDGTMLTLKDTNGEAEVMEVFELTSDRLTFGQTENGMTVKMVWNR